jgi:hypothetical protein
VLSAHQKTARQSRQCPLKKGRFDLRDRAVGWHDHAIGGRNGDGKAVGPSKVAMQVPYDKLKISKS